MSDMLLTYEANPGAQGASIAAFYFNLAGQLCYVLNDGTERKVPMTLANRATADQSLNTQTALQDATNLSFAIAASEEWTAELSLDVGALLSTTGLKVGVSFPVGATVNAVASLVPDVVSNTNYSALRTTANNTAMDFTAAKEANVSNAAVKVSLWVLNGANAGTMQLLFAQSTSSATATTIRKGSSIVARQVV